MQEKLELVFCCYNCLDLPWEFFFQVWVTCFPVWTLLSRIWTYCHQVSFCMKLSDLEDWKGFWGQERILETGNRDLQISWKLSSVQYVSPHLLKKDWWNLKENSLHQGSNQGPLACLAEMLSITPSDLVERLRSHQHLYYIFEYCILFFSKTTACMVAWVWPICRPIFFSAQFFFHLFFSAFFFLKIYSHFVEFFTFYTVFAYSSTRILWFCLKLILRLEWCKKN